jgi:hypothetical protein
MRRLIFDQPERVSQWVFERLPYSDDATAYAAIGIEDADGELILGALYNSFTGFDIDMTVASSGVLWRYKWIIPLFRYPFVQLGCRRVSARCASRNHKSKAALLHLGFVLEGQLRDALPDDDVLLFGMTRAECRWLEYPH